MNDFKGKEITTLKELKISGCEKINVSNNLLKDFEGIESCGDAVKWLNASHNQIHSLKHLKGFTKLNVLNLGYNKIRSSKHLSKLVDLKALILNNNELKTLEGLQNLKELNTLVISNNQLETVDVNSLKKLEKFSASRNKLTEFPNTQNLKSMKDLKLNDNSITQLPPWVSTCNKRLKVVDLGNNQLANIESIGLLKDLPFLENLNLKGNPLCDEKHYHIKIKELMPNLKLLDFKKISDLYYKAIDARAKEESEKKQLEEKQSKLKSVDIPNIERGFKSSNLSKKKSILNEKVESTEHDIDMKELDGETTEDEKTIETVENNNTVNPTIKEPKVADLTELSESAGDTNTPSKGKGRSRSKKRLKEKNMKKLDNTVASTTNCVSDASSLVIDNVDKHTESQVPDNMSKESRKRKMEQEDSNINDSKVKTKVKKKKVKRTDKGKTDPKSKRSGMVSLKTVKNKKKSNKSSKFDIAAVMNPLDFGSGSGSSWMQQV